jgi:hypothetical protein
MASCVPRGSAGSGLARVVDDEAWFVERMLVLKAENDRKARLIRACTMDDEEDASSRADSCSEKGLPPSRSTLQVRYLTKLLTPLLQVAAGSILAYSQPFRVSAQLSRPLKQRRQISLHGKDPHVDDSKFPVCAQIFWCDHASMPVLSLPCENFSQSLYCCSTTTRGGAGTRVTR